MALASTSHGADSCFWDQRCWNGRPGLGAYCYHPANL